MDVALLPGFRSIMTLGPLPLLGGFASLPRVLGSCDTKTALDWARAELAARAAVSFCRATASCEFCSARLRLASKLILLVSSPPFAAAAAMVASLTASPRLSASVSIILTSSTWYDCAALLLYFLTICFASKSVNPALRKYYEHCRCRPVASSKYVAASTHPSPRNEQRSCAPKEQCLAEQSEHKKDT
jgi:hypothetical protein